MLFLRSAAEFRKRPDHAYVAGDTWLYFGFDASFFGFVLWGAPSREDLASLFHFMEDEFARPPHAALIDVSAVEVMSPAAFEVIAGFVSARFDELSKSVTQAALVRPRGF